MNYLKFIGGIPVIVAAGIIDVKNKPAGGILRV
jgi:hypothetical protein